MISSSSELPQHGRQLPQLSPLATPKSQPSSARLHPSSKRPSKVSIGGSKEKTSSASSSSSSTRRKAGASNKALTVVCSPVLSQPSLETSHDHEANIIPHEGEAETEETAKVRSKDAQTNPNDTKAGPPDGKDSIPIPLSAITLQSILIAARAKAASKMSPKQFAAYQLSNDIIVLIQQSLQSERDAFSFVGQPVISVVGEQIDRMAWWFWVVQHAVQEMNPPRGYILPALKMLRQEISSLADIAVEMITVQKTIQKQLQRMASILNTVFARHEDLFGVREWEQKLQELRAEDATEVQEKFEKWVQQSDEASVRLAVFENKAMLIQHETNGEFRPMTLNKLSLASQKEFIKSCLDHMSSALRWSCDHSVQSHEELLKAEKEIQESIDKLVKKLDHLRRVHRLRDSTCAFLLKKSLHNLGLCFYEFIDMVRFIRKLGRFVLLASEHVLRHANKWSHLCDATCLAQLDVVLSELAKNKRRSVSVRFLHHCIGNRISYSEAKKNRLMANFEDYFQRWISNNLSTVQVTVPISSQSAHIVFAGEPDESERIAIRRKSRFKAEARRKKESIPSILSTKELEVEVIHSCSHVRRKPVARTEENIQKKLEEIGIKISTDAAAEDKAVGQTDHLRNTLIDYHPQPEKACVSCTKKSSKSPNISRSVEKTKTVEPT